MFRVFLLLLFYAARTRLPPFKASQARLARSTAVIKYNQDLALVFSDLYRVIDSMLLADDEVFSNSQ